MIVIYVNMMSLTMLVKVEHSNNDSNGGEFEDNFLKDDEDVYEISKVLVDEEMEQEDDDQFAGTSGMHD